MSIGADLGKVGHAFVVGAEKLKAAILWAAGEEKKIAPEVTTLETIANAVVGSIYPGADLVLVAIESTMSKVFNAVDATGDAATADGLNIQLDLATIAAIKAALPTVKAQAVTTPGS